MARKLWTEEEKRIVAEMYPEHLASEIGEMPIAGLFQRKASSISLALTETMWNGMRLRRYVNVRSIYMKIKGKVHCFFEQSGTFKNEFIKLGIPSEDYDIQNNFGETDHEIDLFQEIENAYAGKPSLFDSIRGGARW